MIDTALIPDPDSGVFVGFGANLGRGKDDLRVVLGFATTLNNLFGAIGNLVPDVLRQPKTHRQCYVASRHLIPLPGFVTHTSE